ncbi:hypothetical protein ABS71_04470 [bacterium SCN 62-11]|nr:MAG: hypothetical protein ABS71_04470 [bacterium SCN 62-11]
MHGLLGGRAGYQQKSEQQIQERPGWLHSPGFGWRTGSSLVWGSGVLALASRPPLREIAAKLFSRARQEPDLTRYESSI